MGTISLLKEIECKNIVDNKTQWEEEVCFGDLFQFDENHIMKKMLPLGLYNGISGFLNSSTNEFSNILVPDTSWFKIQ